MSVTKTFGLVCKSSRACHHPYFYFGGCEIRTSASRYTGWQWGVLATSKAEYSSFGPINTFLLVKVCGGCFHCLRRLSSGSVRLFGGFYQRCSIHRVHPSRSDIPAAYLFALSWGSGQHLTFASSGYFSTVFVFWVLVVQFKAQQQCFSSSRALIDSFLPHLNSLTLMGF